MPTMTKRVNITTRIPIRTVSPPLNGTYKNLVMTTGDILKCISKRATVDEILPNGTTIRLTMKNYFTDNGAGLDAVIEKVEEPVDVAADSAIVDTDSVPEEEVATAVVEEPAPEEVPVVVEDNEAPVVPAEPEVAHEDQVVETVQELENTETTTVEEPTPVVEETGEDKPTEKTVEPDATEAQPPKTTRKSSRSRKTTQKPASEEATEEVKADDAAQPAADVVAEEQTAE